MRAFDVRVLLMGGQACVLYGAAEYSGDVDVVVLTTSDALPKLEAALRELRASVIEVPPFDVAYLDRGHAVHFSIPDPENPPLRLDIMSRLRGVDEFAALWSRRTTLALPSAGEGADVTVDVLSLEDLVAAKKTQRDKDWPMLRRLVDADYAAARAQGFGDEAISDEQCLFWMQELRSPEFITELSAVSRDCEPVSASRCAGDSARRGPDATPRGGAGGRDGRRP